jgi:hypothetical protein
MQHGIKWSQNLQIPKLNFKFWTSELIQNCSSTYTTKMMVTKKYHAKLNYNGSIQKWWVHALKPHYKLDYNDIFMIKFIQGVWTKCNAHVGVIVYYNYYSFCYMMMSEAFFSFHFCLLCELFKMKHSLKCGLVA